MANFDQKALIDKPTYSKCNLTFESIGTLQMGIGTPVLHKEVVPGDDWHLSVDQIMRLAPLSSPVFDDVTLHFRAFFVPNRIIDPRWKEFITGGVGLYGSSDSEIAPLSFTERCLVSAPDERVPSVLQPTASATYAAGIGGLADWLNYHFTEYNPSNGRPWLSSAETDYTYANGSTRTYSLLPFLGYQKIYDDWYRNERVQDERLPAVLNYLNETSADDRLLDVDLSNGVHNPFSLWRVNYGKDRYTTALPEPCIGGDVMYGGVGSDGEISINIPVKTFDSYGNVASGALQGDGAKIVNGLDGEVKTIGGSTGDYSYQLRSVGVLQQAAQSAQDTIRNLKMQFKMYSFFMKDTYNGNRYVEFMDSHFDVRVPDSTLDRALYLGDHKVRISFGEVFQTSGAAPESGEGVLGDYAGRGAAYSQDGFIFNEKFLEHGQLYVIGSIVPRAKYYQGIDRKFIKKDRFSYFFPEFQNIGDDVLYSNELFNQGTSADDVFGYAPRWSELKESLDEVHGDFLSSMDEYHFGRVFDSQPTISNTFSQIQTNNRPFSVTDDYSENYLINMRWTCPVARPILMYESF